MPAPALSPRPKQFLQFIQAQARALRADDKPPQTRAEWEARRESLRRRLIRSWGGFPREACPLKPRRVGSFQRDGYRVEKLLLQTRPGIWMTANAYVPDGTGRRPAVLCVHGHWRLAKQEPVVQSRCIGLAKLGFFVLMVDAFGAGERGLGKALGEYHGEMVAGTLWPTGLALAGLQVYENMRAVDYLQSRPEVDPKRIGVTGASGGGNQTMYVGAIDDRIRCVVPVCSVGTYQAYLGAACCMCEVTPSALQYTPESDVLAMVAPRGLLVINATRDGFQFSVGEAKKSIAAARPVFQLYGKSDHLQHGVFESRHDYNAEMRLAMYRFMTRHLRGPQAELPRAEPTIKTEAPEQLRCFPGDSRPDDYTTLPQFAAHAARNLLNRLPLANHLEEWQAQENLMRETLHRLQGPDRLPKSLRVQVHGEASSPTFDFEPEPGISVVARLNKAAGKARGLAVLLDLEHGRKAVDSKLAASATAKGWHVAAADLRATGVTAQPRDKIGRAPDHNTAEWSLWIGRPLLTQWAIDIRRMLDVLGKQLGRLPGEVALIGTGPAGVVALWTAAIEQRVTRIATVKGLASFVTDAPYVQQRLGILLPGILRDVGDVAHLAALAAPRKLVIAGGVNAAAKPLNSKDLRSAYAATQRAYRLQQKPAQLRIVSDAETQSLVDQLLG